MNKNEIKQSALRRINEIDDRFEGDPSSDVVHLYRLLSALALGNLDAYVDRVGPAPIDPEQVAWAKRRIGWPAPTEFELDAIRVINERVAAVEHRKVVAGVFR